MALTLVSHPVGSDSSKIFAGFQKCNVIFKREDLQIDSVESGAGGIKINVTTDLTAYLSIGDTIYVSSESYNSSGQILGITAGDITINVPYIETTEGGYINYKKNYFVELQCVDKNLPDSNLLPFSLESDGDAAGNISIDVSIVNELSTQRGLIASGLVSQSVKEFEIKYREVYKGSSNEFTLVDGKLIILLYAIDTPTVMTILNKLEEPKLYLGYPGAITIALKSLGASSEIELTYNELDINKEKIISGTMGILSAAKAGFLIWPWPANKSLNKQTKYIEFNMSAESTFDFKAPDFAYPDFLTQ